MIKHINPWPDLFITIPVLLLVILGTLVIYSSDPQLAYQQVIFILIGLFFYWFISFIDLEVYNSYVNLLYIAVILLLVIVFVIGIETRGSARWITFLGFQFQPSELAKPIIILSLSKFWSQRVPSWQNIFKSFLLMLPIVGLVLKQPDLGTALTLIAIWISIFIATNVAIVKLIVMSLAGLVFTPVAWNFLKDYQKDRILSFISPARDPLGIGYNAIQSTIAVGSGELFGRGLGRGTQSRLRFLPEFRTDFVFASIAEEFGFIGAMIVLSLYGLIIGRSLKIASNAGSRFNVMIVFGVLGMLFFQIIVNIGMNIGIVPITGITLPLLSYGGSSLVTILLSLGFIASVARFSQREYFVSSQALD